MPIPFKLDDSSLLIGPISQAVNELKVQDRVIIDAAWIKRHGFKGIGSYAVFEAAFIEQLRKSVRMRFVTQRKSDEFAISYGKKIWAFATIS